MPGEGDRLFGEKCLINTRFFFFLKKASVEVVATLDKSEALEHLRVYGIYIFASVEASQKCSKIRRHSRRKLLYRDKFILPAELQLRTIDGAREGVKEGLRGGLY